MGGGNLDGFAAAFNAGASAGASIGAAIGGAIGAAAGAVAGAEAGSVKPAAPSNIDSSTEVAGNNTYATVNAFCSAAFETGGFVLSLLGTLGAGAVGALAGPEGAIAGGGAFIKYGLPYVAKGAANATARSCVTLHNGNEA